MQNLCVSEAAVSCGVHVKVFSGSNNGSLPICNVSNRNDIKHFVVITSLTLYPIEIECKGLIPASYRKIKFESLNPNDAENLWSDKITIYASSLGPPPLPHTFNHVTILSNSTPSSGSETIITNVSAKRLILPVTHTVPPISINIEV